MKTHNVKRISLAQRQAIVAQCEAVESAAAAERFLWTTIKSYRGWTFRFGVWLALHASAEQRGAEPALKIRGFLEHVAWGSMAC